MPDVPWWLPGLALALFAAAVVVWGAVLVETTIHNIQRRRAAAYDRSTWEEAAKVLDPRHEYRGYDT